MVGAILTQNTAWTNVEKAIANFGSKLNPAFIAAASHEELAQIIRPSGYYNQKAIKLKALVEWFAGYNYDIAQASAGDGQSLREELLAIKGIGPETADSILLYALNKPFFVVDAYTRRILYRLGYDAPDTYEGLQQQITASLQIDVYLFNEFHGLIVEHAKRYCQKRPTCAGCPLGVRCQQRIQE
jgi:endonuclease-3 related protein